MQRVRPLVAAAHRACRGSRGWDWYYRATAEVEQAPDLAHQLLFEPKHEVQRPRAWMDFKIGEREGTHKLVFELAVRAGPRRVGRPLRGARPA